CQTCSYVDIIDDVIRVIVIHKVVSMNRKINGGSNKREDKANEKLRFYTCHRLRPSVAASVGGPVALPAVGALYTRCDRITVVRYSPPCITARRGGCVIKKMLRSHRNDAAGGGFPLCSQSENHPGLATADASRHFIDCSATPPCGHPSTAILSIPIRLHLL